jgi:hypothetical protein
MTLDFNFEPQHMKISMQRVALPLDKCIFR